MFDDYSSSAIKFCSESSPGGNQVDGLPPGPNGALAEYVDIVMTMAFVPSHMELDL